MEAEDTINDETRQNLIALNLDKMVNILIIHDDQALYVIFLCRKLII